MLDDADYAGYKNNEINKCGDLFLMKLTFIILNLKNKT